MQLFGENTVYMADFTPTNEKLGGERHLLLSKSAMSVFIELSCIMYKQVAITFVTQERVDRAPDKHSWLIRNLNNV